MCQIKLDSETQDEQNIGLIVLDFIISWGRSDIRQRVQCANCIRGVELSPRR